MENLLISSFLGIDVDGYQELMRSKGIKIH